MPRYISFMLTTPQIRARTKTVTRRLGWKALKPGTVLMGAEKCQGLGKGGKIKPLGLIRVVGVRQEQLRRMTDDLAYGFSDAVAEGFPGLIGDAPQDVPRYFVDFFCRSHKGCTPDSEVTRIQFEYLD